MRTDFIHAMNAAHKLIEQFKDEAKVRIVKTDHDEQNDEWCVVVGVWPPECFKEMRGLISETLDGVKIYCRCINVTKKDDKT